MGIFLYICNSAKNPENRKIIMRKIVKAIAYILGFFLVVILTSVIYFRFAVNINEPNVEIPAMANKPVQTGDGYVSLGNNWLRQSKSGLWEMYVEGTAIERGVAFGKLTGELMHYQESVFVNQIRELVPSDTYINMLKYMIRFYNRNITDYIPTEYQEEIYGTSLACPSEFNFVGSPYERQLNYHAAHDLGHAMQDYMLVGCTSFAVWGSESEDSALIVGRNFDFYMGENFARNKLVSFYNPAQGYKFAMVGWAGMTGVLSGMNEKGLTVTINAAKSSMPTSSAMPISLLARKILQYAGNIQEAFSIAGSAKTFVSESILIGSAADKCAAIIEKSTEKTALFTSQGNSIVCANHYQSETFKEDERNVENIKTSDSPYRQKRAEELLVKNSPVNYRKAVNVLRDTRGLQDENIGLGNEKSLNQLIAHHSVVFMPESGLMWVSTQPWQLGEYVAYDLNKIFAEADPSVEVYEEFLNVPSDTFLLTSKYNNFLMFREVKKVFQQNIKEKVSVPDSTIYNFIRLNPDFYLAYDIAGDAFSVKNARDSAVFYWQKALSLEIPKQREREAIEKKVIINEAALKERR